MVWGGDLQRKVRFELRVDRFATSFLHEGIHIFDTHSQALGKRINSKIAQQVVDIFTVSLPNLTLPRIYGGDTNQSAYMHEGGCCVLETNHARDRMAAGYIPLDHAHSGRGIIRVSTPTKPAVVNKACSRRGARRSLRPSRDLM